MVWTLDFCLRRGNTAGSHHTLLRLQADGHAGLHRLPDVHPAPRPSTGESIPPCAMVDYSAFACARQARPNWTDLLQEGTTELLQAIDVCRRQLRSGRFWLSGSGVRRCRRPSSRPKLDDIMRCSETLVSLMAHKVLPPYLLGSEPPDQCRLAQCCGLCLLPR